LRSERREALSILVSGMVAAVPGQGGATWAVLQYVLGLSRLGHRVTFVEPVPARALQPAGAPLQRSANAAYFERVAAEFGLAGRAALWLEGTRETAGLAFDRLSAAARQADLLLNLAGSLAGERLVEHIPIRVYLDLDPAFTQLWQTVEGIDMRLAGHTHFVTVGLNVGQPDCCLPDCGKEWIPTLQPVALPGWPAATRVERAGLSTILNWRSYGSIHYEGRRYGQKAHSLRQFMDLPGRAPEPFTLALAIHPQETQDRAALAANGWRLVDPSQAAGTPAAYRRFIQGSWAEFGIAKSGYVVSRSGWFGDRSACYLAAGRPVVAQDTGFGSWLPTGRGLFAFSSADDVLAAVDALRRNYAAHARAARQLAEDCFDSDKVLRRLLQRVLDSPGRPAQAADRKPVEASLCDTPPRLAPQRPGSPGPRRTRPTAANG
jgi:hypothetical protein